MSEAQRIAAKLTEAQRKALLFAPDDTEWMGRNNLGRCKLSFAAMDRPDLGRPQLCEVRVDIGGVFDARLTPLGLEVRSILEAQS